MDSPRQKSSRSAPIEQEPSAQELEAVGQILKEFAALLADWPAIFIIGAGLALLVADFLIEVTDPQMSSTEYVATLIVAAALCLIGGALVVALSRQLRHVAEAAVGEEISEAKSVELRRLMGLPPAKDSTPAE